MTRMRGVDPFPELWARRTTLVFEEEEETLEVLSLADLVAAKKTQRDKDGPMVRRLVDVNYLTYRNEPTPERVAFWLRELRTPELLVEAAEAHPDAAARHLTPAWGDVVYADREAFSTASQSPFSRGGERQSRLRRHQNGHRMTRPVTPGARLLDTVRRRLASRVTIMVGCIRPALRRVNGEQVGQAL